MANTRKERHTLTFDSFRGVDFSSSVLEVSSKRATRAKNFINEYGVNRKRHGWEELCRISYDTQARRINGIFEYKNGGYRCLLVHAGNSFYSIPYRADTGEYDFSVYYDITNTGTYAPSAVEPSRLTDTRSMAFANASRLYITGCGDYLVFGTWDDGESFELRRVENDIDTYIPTTAYSIDHDGNTSDTVRGNIDLVNMLSSKRKNSLLGTGTVPATYTLDAGSVDEGTVVLVTLSVMESGVLTEYTLESDEDVLYKVKKNGAALSPVSCGTLERASGKITFNISTVPPIEGDDNIVVTYEKSTAGHSERINTCTFGTVFGVAGNTDRLFLAGNEEYPNTDFFSEALDYTYFPDRYSATMGSSTYPLKGYIRLSDGTLATFKEEGGGEATVFYRSGEYQYSYDGKGNITNMTPLFPISAGAIGESIISKYASCNFAGDNIILSKNGVFGIVLTSNVATTERYARERSRNINEALRSHNLSEAVAVSYDNRYYLAVDGVCYVADARYKYTAGDDIDGSYNYEWWYFEGIPARVFAVIDGALYFGTENGKICRFGDDYADRERWRSEPGELGIGDRSTIINVTRENKIAAGDEIIFETPGIYALVCENAEVRGNRIYAGVSEIENIREGESVFADRVGESSLEVGVQYKISGVDRGACSFALSDGERDITISEGGFRLCRHISGTPLYIDGYTGESFSVKLYRGGGVLMIVGYGASIPPLPTASIIHKENVVAEWYTPVLNLGSSMHLKTLLGMSVSTESEVNGKLSFGYETRREARFLTAKGINAFVFDDLSFENFSFDTGFSSSYSVKTNARNFNFIVFRFRSESNADLAINGFSVTYKINKNARGVN